MVIPRFVQGLDKLQFQDEKIPVHIVKTKYGDISFAMFGETTEFRVRTFFTKEPETLAWIDGFSSEDVMWDIGANIGCYSLYAARRKDVVVCSFEPSPVNYWLLSANVINNSNGCQITTYPFGLSDNSMVLKWAPHTSPGSADNQLTCCGTSAVQVYSIDDLVGLRAAPFPNHIKLDVDGIELSILNGAQKTLSDGRLKSVMVEIDESEKQTTHSIINMLMRLGFSEPVKRHSPYYDENYYLPMGNYLFMRV